MHTISKNTQDCRDVEHNVRHLGTALHGYPQNTKKGKEVELRLVE